MWLQTGLGVGWEEMIHFSHCPLSLGPDSWGFPLLRQSHPFPGGGRLCMSVTPGRTIGAYKCSSPRHPYRSISGPPHLTNSPPGMVPVSNPPSLHSICHTDTPSARDPRTSRTLPILYPHIKAVLDRLCPLISPAVCSHLLATPWTLPAPHTSASPSLFLTGIFADQGIMGCRTEDSFSARQRRWSQLLQRSQGSCSSCVTAPGTLT